MATTDASMSTHGVIRREPTDAYDEALLYVILRYTDMEPEDAYSAVFRAGGKITWQ